MPRSPSNLGDPDDAEALLRGAAEILVEDPRRRGAVVEVPAAGRLVAAGDLHDNPLHLSALVDLARLEAPGSAGLVVHELIHGDRLVDGIDLSHRIVLKVADLVCRHPGRVLPLLANHEIAQVTGRGVSKGAGNSVELFADGVHYVFGDEAERIEEALNDFMRSMPLALRSAADERGRRAFCAHSLPTAAALRSLDLGAIERPLSPEAFQPGGLAYQFTWGRDLDPEHLERMASLLGVDLFLLGHQHAETGIELRPPNAVILNSDHARGVALPVDLGNLPDPEGAVMLAVPLSALIAPSAPDAPGERR
ncbi:MAG TPA: hypothetical protein PKC43_00855 [Phycisphaerales bacterium]|nr:hypothetical protein [Phycisphaerales bacterium]HMP35975.1 hypothetical protein [Phycisphaerales bacterium]